MEPFTIHADIRHAETLPATVYREQRSFDAIVERVLRRSWQALADQRSLSDHSLQPFTWLPELKGEELLLVQSPSGPRLLSNVCTHRGMLLALDRQHASQIRCGYHGRCFGLDGGFKSMPEFDSAKDFPRPEDSLKTYALEDWQQMLFFKLSPSMSFKDWTQGLERVAFLDFTKAKARPELDRDYIVEANFLLYCDNYLEGFHIPFVHPGLNQVLDYHSYRTELLPWGTLQVGLANSADIAFELPDDHPDAGQRVAAYYFFLFPSTMINVYPWGISWNFVEPMAVDKTRVRYQTWVWNEPLRAKGAGAALDTVELEDERVVEAVQRGIQSRAYKRGRYSPKQETGLHHFHRLLQQSLFEN